MLDSSLVQSKFLGRDGFRWWIGQIPPVSAQGKQANGGGWGNRVKVRIVGYHPYSQADLPDEDLPWAQVLLSTSDGSGAANRASNIKLSQGDIVFGFFLDGDDAQIPVIMGCFGRTSQVPSAVYKNPFEPFTGYTDNIREPNGTLKPNQDNQQSSASQKSPRSVSSQQAKQIGEDEITFFTGIGDVIDFANGASDSTVSKIMTEVDNLTKKVQDITNGIRNAAGEVSRILNQEIGKITAKIQKISSGIVGSMVNGLYKALAPVLNKGLKLLYKTVYSTVLAATKSDTIAHKAGVAAQTALVAPIKKLQNLLPCIANNILSALGDTIKNILTSVVDNVTNFVSCAGEQVVGSLVNFIIGGVSGALSSVMGALSSISGGFSIDGFMRMNAGGISGLASIISCNETAPEYNSQTNLWVIGKGAKQSRGVDFNSIVETAAKAYALAQSALAAGDMISSLASSVGSFDIFNPKISSLEFDSLLSSCYTGPPVRCFGPTVNIFGGGGTGATARAILGAIVEEEAVKTASIIGIEVLQGGSGYSFPPFIEIVDTCNQGYGAVARSVIDENGTVTAIYCVSPGENYPISYPEGDLITSYISDTSPIIIQPGSGYSNSDIVRDTTGNTYTITTNANGSITSITSINTDANNGNLIEIVDYPTITIQSETGTGAILIPTFRRLPEDFQGEVKQRIYCIRK